MDAHSLQTPVPSTKARMRLAIFLLIFLGALPHLSSIDAPFVYDEQGQIAENPTLMDYSNLWEILTLRTMDDAHIINGRRPLVLVSYFIDAAGGIVPSRFRVTNLGLHAGATLLFFLLLGHLFESKGRRPYLLPFVCAMIFTLHPLHSETVHMAAYRPDILYTLFALGMAICLIKAAREESAPRSSTLISGSLICYFFALLSKEAGVIAPAIMTFIWALYPQFRLNRRKTAFIAGGWVSVTLVFGALCAGSGSYQALTGAWNGISLQPPENFWSAPWIFAGYLKMLFVPYPLIIDRVVAPVASGSDPRFLAGCTLMSLALLSAWLLRKRLPSISLSIGCILAAYLPVSNLIPLFNPVAERYAYFMVLGFALFSGVLLASRPDEASALSASRKFSIVLICSIFAALTLMRMQDFTDSRTLWTRTLIHEPDSARAYTWLGLNLKQQGLTEEALQHFERAMESNPHEVSALINIGIMQGEAGDYGAAENSFREAIELRPEKAGAYWNLAVTLKEHGSDEEVREMIEKVLILEPDHLPALTGKLMLSLDGEQLQEALDVAEHILRLTPKNKELRELTHRLRTSLHQ